MSRKAAAVALPLVAEHPTLARLRDAAAACRACDLWEPATQTVFGAGKKAAEVLFVGEQPGDAEDKAGAPFVGPAGRLLDSALVAAGIDRRLAYVTNVVKHFKWEPRGKRRMHKKPNQVEIDACRPWLEAELAVVRPTVLVCLGSTAAQALLGRGFRVTLERGRLVASPLAPYVLATVHPSSILRAPDDDTRHAEMERFVADLSRIPRLLEAHAHGRAREA
jgi:DNA polymerase